MATRKLPSLKAPLWFSWVFEWGQLRGKYNWITITPLCIRFENDHMLGRLEFELVVLGLGLTVSLRTTETDLVDQLQEQLDDLHEEHSSPLHDDKEETLH